MRNSKPIKLRYLAAMSLDDGQDVGIGFDYMNEALGFFKRINGPADYWEVLDLKTGNVVASAKEN